ncbi:SPOR domain-containing protein [Cellulomonas endophytica]|uniref:SPOR domain-containing protein n=1 Tax=Cellulomonas endophytica TaxID=2494735 RepID=UPI00101045AA|nr:SPOR domain-containing protein [Cellulomonas endophytica]
MAGDYWFNTQTRQVEEGRQSDWSNLMGPYGSREEAEQALAKADARSRAWDAQDAEDD